VKKSHGFLNFSTLIMKSLLWAMLYLFPFSISASNFMPENTLDVEKWIKDKPLVFIENKGQIKDSEGFPAENVLFKATLGNCDIYITQHGLSYVYFKKEEENKISNDHLLSLNSEGRSTISYFRFDMNLEGANISKSNCIEELPADQGYYNYYYSNNSSGILEVQAFEKIIIRNIYNGIDWVIFANGNSKDCPIKYDFIVQPYANYKDIRIKYINAQSIDLTETKTKLIIQTIAGKIEEGNVYTYQEFNNGKQKIECHYLIDAEHEVSFQMGEYDKSEVLIIDPLVWATYYGGSDAESFSAICTDNEENIFITGYSVSTNFPTQFLPNAFNIFDLKGDRDIVILKFNKHGVRLWATYYGGSSTDEGSSICVDNQGFIYITGITSSNNFPTQKLAGAYWDDNYSGIGPDAFLLKFNNSGDRIWATYFGGNYSDIGSYLCSDSNDNIYLVGTTQSTDFPTRQFDASYYQQEKADYLDVFISRFSSHGVLQWSTHYGGNGIDYCYSACVDGENNLYLTGNTHSTDFPVLHKQGAYFQDTYQGKIDTFILKFNSLGERLWATYYGGNNTEYGYSICSDRDDNIYLTGFTQSMDFPTQNNPGAFFQGSLAGTYADVFILKFNSIGERQWATFYGGSIYDYGNSICTDSKGNVFITGETNSSNFPTQETIGEYWHSYNGGGNDVFLLKFNAEGERLWGTFYGSTDYDAGKSIVADKQNSVFIAGVLKGKDAYTIDYGNKAYYDKSWNGSADGFILKIIPCNNQKITSINTNRNNICNNDYGDITLTAIGGSGDSLKWYSDNYGLNYIGNNASISIPAPNVTTTYFARWESFCDTSACDSITIFVFPVKESKVIATVCSGEVFTVGNHYYSDEGIYIDTLTSISGCDSIVTSKLSVNPIQQSVIDPLICQGDSFTIGNHNYNTEGLYLDTLQTTYGCDSIITTFLKVRPKPLVNLGNDTIICPGDIIILSPGIGFNQYLWSNGTILNSMEIQSPGTYSVTVSDSLCSERDEILIGKCIPDIWLPNAFSPNNDGLNDFFVPVSLEVILKFQVWVYNKWGQLIFESDNLANTWDGTLIGHQCPSGVYTYYVRYLMDSEFFDSEMREKRGIVTLIR
jgi:gliding motility-associated-like protein